MGSTKMRILLLGFAFLALANCDPAQNNQYQEYVNSVNPVEASEREAQVEAVFTKHLHHLAQAISQVEMILQSTLGMVVGRTNPGLYKVAIQMTSFTQLRRPLVTH